MECSKPTVWDGDVAELKIPTTSYSVLSPPCGMVTTDFVVLKGGGKKVLSPPCGMVTYYPQHRFISSALRRGSEPTVWDGDQPF